MWLRVESAYIFHHKYPIPEYSMINGNHEGHSSREAPQSENYAVKLIALLFTTPFHDCGWSNVTTGATSYFAAWLHMDESLYSQDFLGLSQWQLGIGRWHACIIILVNVFVCFLSFWLEMGEGFLDATICCAVFLWDQALYSDRIRFLIPKM